MQQQVRRTERIRKLPSTLDIYHHQAKSYNFKINNNGTKYPISEFLGYDKLSEDYKKYSINLALIHEPETFEETMTEPHWRDAIKAELKALVDNETWSIVQKPKNIKPIGCRYVFKKN